MDGLFSTQKMHHHQVAQAGERETVTSINFRFVRHAKHQKAALHQQQQKMVKYSATWRSYDVARAPLTPPTPPPPGRVVVVMSSEKLRWKTTIIWGKPLFPLLLFSPLSWMWVVTATGCSQTGCSSRFRVWFFCIILSWQNVCMSWRWLGQTAAAAAKNPSSGQSHRNHLSRLQCEGLFIWYFLSCGYAEPHKHTHNQHTPYFDRSFSILLPFWGSFCWRAGGSNFSPDVFTAYRMTWSFWMFFVSFFFFFASTLVCTPREDLICCYATHQHPVLPFRSQPPVHLNAINPNRNDSRTGVLPHTAWFKNVNRVNMCRYVCVCCLFYADIWCFVLHFCCCLCVHSKTTRRIHRHSIIALYDTGTWVGFYWVVLDWRQFYYSFYTLDRFFVGWWRWRKNKMKLIDGGAWWRVKLR